MKTKHLLGALLSFLYTIIFLAVEITMKKDIFFILRKRVLRTTFVRNNQYHHHRWKQGLHRNCRKN